MNHIGITMKQKACCTTKSTTTLARPMQPCDNVMSTVFMSVESLPSKRPTGWLSQKLVGAFNNLEKAFLNMDLEASLLKARMEYP
jgi:hypothetical protein